MLSPKPVLTLNTNVSTQSYGEAFSAAPTPHISPNHNIAPFGREWIDDRSPLEKVSFHLHLHLLYLSPQSTTSNTTQFPAYRSRANSILNKSKSMTNAEVRDLTSVNVTAVLENLKTNPPKSLEEATRERRERAESITMIRKNSVKFLKSKIPSSLPPSLHISSYHKHPPFTPLCTVAFGVVYGANMRERPNRLSHRSHRRARPSRQRRATPSRHHPARRRLQPRPRFFLNESCSISKPLATRRCSLFYARGPR